MLDDESIPGLPPAEGRAQLLQRRGTGRKGLACWLALPPRIDPDRPPLVAVHGIHRAAEAQARAFAGRAARLGCPVIAPVFDEPTWPLYQQAVRRGRADLALLDLLAELRLAGIWQGRRIRLFGYSGGGQFAHRFAMLYPHLVERLAVASAGWFTFPDDAAFPYGLGRGKGGAGGWGPRIAAGLDRFLEIPVDVCVGALDTVADEHTRRRAGLDAQQGADRVARATRWVEALQDAALRRGLAPRARLSLLPGCGHDFTACIARGGLDRIVLPDLRPAPSAGTADGLPRASAARPRPPRVDQPSRGSPR